jgi:epoxyqueuosine reductase
MLINPTIGVNILLAEIVTTLALKTDMPFEYTCTECSRCIRACPTGALSENCSFDPNKCISYLTIEHKGDIPPSLANKIGDSIFGCDRCVTVCPFYANAKPRKNTEFKYYPDRAKLDLAEILEMTPEQFQHRFSDSPILRTGLQKLKTNASTCFENLS